MKTYPDPDPRSFAQWCVDLGMSTDGRIWPDNQLMTYLDFCFLPETTLRKVKEGPLYGFWRQYGDMCGEARTVREWLDDLGWQIVEPTEDDLKDLNLFLGYDGLWDWGSGKLEGKDDTIERESIGSFITRKLKKLFTDNK